MTAREKRLERAQMQVLFKVPFFATGVMRLPVTFDEGVDTACTDGKGIRWNPKWFDSLPDACLPTVLCHEVCHCLLGHLWRMPIGGDWEDWNIATDHCVNLMLKEFSAQVMQGRLADPFPFPDPQDAYCADPQYIGMSEEMVYSKVHANKTKRPNPNPGNGPPGGGTGKGKGQGNQPAPGQGPGRGSMPKFGEMQQPNHGMAQGQADKKLASDWERAAIQAANLAKSRGNLPAGFERLVDSIVNPQIPWQTILRSLLREQAFDDWDFMRPAMEYCGSDFILPSLHSERMGPAVFAKDTSGSIDHQLLCEYTGEEQVCLDELRPSKLVDICCDAAIHRVKEYEAGDTIDNKAPGGGGTDFRPVFEYVDKMPDKPKVIVYLTDLCGTFPDHAPDIPVIWVTWTKGGTAPFGEVVYAGHD